MSSLSLEDVVASFFRDKVWCNPKMNINNCVAAGLYTNRCCVRGWYRSACGRRAGGPSRAGGKRAPVRAVRRALIAVFTPNLSRVAIAALFVYTFMMLQHTVMYIFFMYYYAMMLYQFMKYLQLVSFELLIHQKLL